MELKKLSLKDGTIHEVIALERTRPSATGVGRVIFDEAHGLAVHIESLTRRLGEATPTPANEEALEIARQLGIPTDKVDIEAYDSDGTITTKLNNLSERVGRILTAQENLKPVYITLAEAKHVVSVDDMLPSTGDVNPRNDYERMVAELAAIVSLTTTQSDQKKG